MLVNILASCSQSVTRPESGVIFIDLNPLVSFVLFYANSMDCSISDGVQIIPDACTTAFSLG